MVLVVIGVLKLIGVVVEVNTNGAGVMSAFRVVILQVVGLPPTAIVIEVLVNSCGLDCNLALTTIVPLVDAVVVCAALYVGVAAIAEVPTAIVPPDDVTEIGVYPGSKPWITKSSDRVAVAICVSVTFVNAKSTGVVTGGLVVMLQVSVLLPYVAFPILTVIDFTALYVADVCCAFNTIVPSAPTTTFFAAAYTVSTVVVPATIVPPVAVTGIL